MASLSNLLLLLLLLFTDHRTWLLWNPEFDHNLSHLNPAYTDRLCFVKFSNVLSPVPGSVTSKPPAGYYKIEIVLNCI